MDKKDSRYSLLMCGERSTGLTLFRAGSLIYPVQGYVDIFEAWRAVHACQRRYFESTN